MSRTITALFDSRSDAEAGQARLVAANIDASNIRVHEGSTDTAGSSSMSSSTMSSGSTGSYGRTSTTGTADGETGIWSSIKNAFLPDEDRAAYEEGIRRGGFVLSADVDEDEVARAIEALEGSNSVDVDERAQTWRSEGWNAAAAPASRPAMFGSETDRTVNPVVDDDNVIPVIEEQLVVGKREAERGGVRVRSYVTEKPVHEQVRLRQEQVQVERRPVDRAVDVNADAFEERTISMTETSEEAVVGKTARVVEEVSLNKSVDERVEDINETVRRTDVEVENLGSGDAARAGNGRNSGAAGTTGNTLAGLGNEAIGNVKQGLGSVTGNDNLERSGEAQEREGEAQQGKTPGGY